MSEPVIWPQSERERGPRMSRGTVIGVTASVVLALALALAFAFGVFLPSAVPSGGHAASGASVDGYQWGQPETSLDLAGVWADGDVIVVSGNDGLTGYYAASGKVKWTWNVPDGGIMCGMSETTVGGYGAFDYGVFNSAVGIEQCDKLETINTSTGSLGWSTPVSLRESGAQGFADLFGAEELSIADGVVYAPYASTHDPVPGGSDSGADADVIAVSAKTGSVLYKSELGPTGVVDGCTLSGYARPAGANLYVLGTCHGTAELLTLSGTGTTVDVKQVAALPGCVKVTTATQSAVLTSDGTHLVIKCIISSSNAVLYTVPAGDTNHVISLDMAGVSATNVGGDYEIGNNYPNILISGDVLYVPSASDPGYAAPTTGIIAIDLTTGKQLWRQTLVRSPGSQAVSEPLAVDGAGVVVVAGDEGALSLDTLSAANGSMRGAEKLTAAQNKAFSEPSIGFYGTSTANELAIAFPSSSTSEVPLLVALPLPPAQ